MRLALLIGLVCSCAFSVRATNLPVNFNFAELPPNSTQVTLPFLLDGVTDTMFLKFKVPGIANVTSINSFDIDIAVFDNGDGGGETGTIQFALPAVNITLGTFFPNLNRSTPGSPVVLPISLTPDQIAQVFPAIQDGNFRIKILRDSGDFFVGGGVAFIDANLASVPEPASFLTVISGLIVAGAWLRRRVRTVV